MNVVCLLLIEYEHSLTSASASYDKIFRYWLSCPRTLTWKTPITHSAVCLHFSPIHINLKAKYSCILRVVFGIWFPINLQKSRRLQLLDWGLYWAQKKQTTHWWFCCCYRQSSAETTDAIKGYTEETPVGEPTQTSGNFAGAEWKDLT